MKLLTALTDCKKGNNNNYNLLYHLKGISRRGSLVRSTIIARLKTTRRDTAGHKSRMQSQLVAPSRIAEASKKTNASAVIRFRMTAGRSCGVRYDRVKIGQEPSSEEPLGCQEERTESAAAATLCRLRWRVPSPYLSSFFPFPSPV